MCLQGITYSTSLCTYTCTYTYAQLIGFKVFNVLYEMMCKFEPNLPVRHVIDSHSCEQMRLSLKPLVGGCDSRHRKKKINFYLISEDFC